MLPLRTFKNLRRKLKEGKIRLVHKYDGIWVAQEKKNLLDLFWIKLISIMMMETSVMSMLSQHETATNILRKKFEQIVVTIIIFILKLSLKYRQCVDKGSFGA